MTRVLLDTSAYSAFFRGHPDVKLAVQRADEIVLHPVVLGELKAGFRRGSRADRNESDLAKMLASPRARLVDVTSETSERYALIVNFLRQQGTPAPGNDIWIAASAMEHGLRLLTTDAHYLKMPQVLVEYCAAV